MKTVVKKGTAIILMLLLVCGMITGCGTSSKRTPSFTETEDSAGETRSQEVSTEETDAAEETSSSENGTELNTGEESSAGNEETEPENTEPENSTPEETESIEVPAMGTVRIGSLKGPTSMGLVAIMDAKEKGTASQNYEFTMVTAADELVAMVAGGKVDIALLPANVASVLYGKTGGAVQVININTLGVLYLVEDGNSIQSMSDLKGKTIYMTGKGTTPEYCVRYLLAQNGLTESDVTLEFKAEATEVASILAQTEDAIGVLPQPFVTTAMMNNTNLRIALDLSAEWDKTADSSMVTGVTIVQKSFLENQPEAVADFIADHQYSVAAGSADIDQTAQLIEHFGIIQAAVAKAAYPYCNIVCMTGQDMKRALSGYYNVLYEQDPSSIGGALPGDDFYWMP